MGTSKAFPRTKQSIAFALSDLYLCHISTTTTRHHFQPPRAHPCMQPLASAISSSLPAPSLSPFQVGKGGDWLVLATWVQVRTWESTYIHHQPSSQCNTQWCLGEQNLNLLKLKEIRGKILARICEKLWV